MKFKTNVLWMLFALLPSLSYAGDWWMLAAQRNSQGKRTGFAWADLNSVNVSNGQAGVWLNLVSILPMTSTGETGKPLTYTSMMVFIRFDCRKNAMRNEQLVYRDQGENLVYMNQAVRQEWLAYMPNSPWELAYNFSCKGQHRDAWRHKGDIQPQKFSREHLRDDLGDATALTVVQEGPGSTSMRIEHATQISSEKIGRPWIKTELNQSYMSTLSKSECMSKTMASIKATHCASDSCLQNYGGILGDCVTWAKGSNSEFCMGYDSKYITQYCSASGYDAAICGLAQGGKAAFIQTGLCKQ